MINSLREQQAYNAYLKFLAGKGASQEELSQRSGPLLQLLPLLDGCAMEGNAYRERVEAVLDLLERNVWPAFLTVAREFYYFWASDIKAIAAMNGGSGYRIRQWPGPMPPVDLPALWKALDQEKFALAETWPLKAYISTLRDEGAEKSVVETRSKLVKLLLLQLRSVKGKDSHHYRIAVDATLPYFALRETRVLFLIVVRDFYYFWIGDPDAALHVTLEIRQTAT